MPHLIELLVHLESLLLPGTMEHATYIDWGDLWAQAWGGPGAGGVAAAVAAAEAVLRLAARIHHALVLKVAGEYHQAGMSATMAPKL